MNAPDAAARFGSGRAVPRIEDRALLAGRGRFTDNVAVPGQTVIAFLRSPYAHARIVGDRRRRRRARCRACSRVFTGAELGGGRRQADADDARLQARRRPQRRRRPPRRALAHEFARYVGEAVVAVVAETREAARDALEAIVRRLRGAAGGDRRRAPRPPPGAPARHRRRARQHRRRDAPRRRRPRPRRRSPAPRMRVALDLVNQRARAGRRWSRAASSPRSTRRAAGSTVRISNQMPTAVRGGARRRAARPRADAGARPRRRRRRRLRHEDRRVSGRHRRRLRGARARSGRCAGRPSAARSSCRRRTAATSPAAPSSRSTPTAGCWRCACARSPTSAPTRRRRASRSSC